MVSINSDLRLKKGAKIQLYGRGPGNPPRGRNDGGNASAPSPFKIFPDPSFSKRGITLFGKGREGVFQFAHYLFMRELSWK
jgi:hypothetical protein